MSNFSFPKAPGVADALSWRGLDGSHYSEKGCSLAASELPDVILMDLEMPDDDRWEAVRRLKNDPQNPRHPNHRHVRACG